MAESCDCDARRLRKELPSKRKERARLRRLSASWDKPSARYWTKPRGSKARKQAFNRYRECTKAQSDLKLMRSERDVERAIASAEHRLDVITRGLQAIETGMLADFEDREELREIIETMVDGKRMDVGTRQTEIRLGRFFGGSGRDDGRVRRAKAAHSKLAKAAQPILDELSA